MAEAKPFDFDALAQSAKETELPKRESGRKRVVEHNPFIDLVSSSYSDGKGREFKLPKSQHKTAVNLIRDAAKQLGIGVRIVLSPKGEELENAPDNRNVTVQFQGQDKRKYAPRKSKTENAENATPASV